MINKKLKPVKVHLQPDKRLIVWDSRDGNRLYGEGFYGRPQGVAKPREEFDTPLILDSFEGIYLEAAGRIKVYMGDRPVHSDELKELLFTTDERFDVKLMVYTDLKEKGFVVTPGIKYGSDFAVYERGPGLEHSPYIVRIQSGDSSISASELVKSGRLATTVRKSFIIAVVEGKSVRYLEFNWWRA